MPTGQRTYVWRHVIRVRAAHVPAAAAILRARADLLCDLYAAATDRGDLRADDIELTEAPRSVALHVRHRGELAINVLSEAVAQVLANPRLVFSVPTWS